MRPGKYLIFFLSISVFICTLCSKNMCCNVKKIALVLVVILYLTKLHWVLLLYCTLQDLMVFNQINSLPIEKMFTGNLSIIINFENDKKCYCYLSIKIPTINLFPLNPRRTVIVSILFCCIFQETC